MSDLDLCYMPATSIQIIGSTYRDADVMRAAMAYETEAGQWFTGPDLRPAGPA